MTLWERIEELERRVGELEARVPRAAPVVEPLLNEDGLSERSLRALWSGAFPGPDPVTLAEAVELLAQWATWQKGPLNRTKDFLARARVATEKP